MVDEVLTQEEYPTDEQEISLHSLLFGVQRSIRYHNRRRHFFNTLHQRTKERLHTNLSQRFIGLEQDITLTKDPTEEDLHVWGAWRLYIEADEPPVLRVLDILCHNELVLAMGYPRSELYVVPWWKRLLAPFVSISCESIKRKNE